jgi:hypothetical protein
MYQYWLYRSQNSLNSFVIHQVIDHPDTVFMDDLDIVAGNSYAYCLMAIDSAGNQSEFSDTVQVGLPRIDWTLNRINNLETTYVSLDTILSDPDHSRSELNIVISDTNNILIHISEDSMQIIPNPPAYSGTGGFFFEVYDPDGFSDAVRVDLNILQTAPTGIDDARGNIPQNYHLAQNYPNPFNPVTQIRFSLPKNTLVLLNLYNALGEKVETILADQLSAGTYQIRYDGHHLPSGIYILQMETSEFVGSVKMILLK